MKTFELFIEQKQIELGVMQLLEAVEGADDASIEDLKSIAKAPIPDEEKKGMIRSFWEKHKTKIKFTLGASAIALLIWAGINWKFIAPFAGKAAGAVVDAAKDAGGWVADKLGWAAGAAADLDLSKPIRALIDGHDVYIEKDGQWIKSTIQKVVQMAGKATPDSNGVHIGIWQTETGRASTEEALKNLLHKNGIESNFFNKLLPSMTQQPLQAPLPAH